MLFYVQKGTTEAWKDNLLDELAKGMSEVTMVEELFAKMKNEFGKISKAKRKMEQLQTIEQGNRTYDKYV